MPVTVVAAAAAIASTAAVAVPLAFSAALLAPLQRGQSLAEHGRRRHELLGPQSAPPLGRALFAAATATVRFAAALLAAALAAAATAAAADPAVPGDVALAAVVQVVAELGGEVARRRVVLAENERTSLLIANEAPTDADSTLFTSFRFAASAAARCSMAAPRWRSATASSPARAGRRSSPLSGPVATQARLPEQLQYNRCDGRQFPTQIPDDQSGLGQSFVDFDLVVPLLAGFCMSTGKSGRIDMSLMSLTW